MTIFQPARIGGVMFVLSALAACAAAPDPAEIDPVAAAAENKAYVMFSVAADPAIREPRKFGTVPVRSLEFRQFSGFLAAVNRGWGDNIFVLDGARRDFSLGLFRSDSVDEERIYFVEEAPAGTYGLSSLAAEGQCPTCQRIRFTYGPETIAVTLEKGLITYIGDFLVTRKDVETIYDDTSDPGDSTHRPMGAPGPMPLYPEWIGHDTGIPEIFLEAHPHLAKHFVESDPFPVEVRGWREAVADIAE